MPTEARIILTTITNFESGVDVARSLENIERTIAEAHDLGITAEARLDLDVLVLDWFVAVDNYKNILIERINTIPEHNDETLYDEDGLTGNEIDDGLEPLVYDDLTALTHIGSATQQRLYDDNVRTYAEVAQLEPSDLTKYPRITYDEAAEIIQQAKNFLGD